MSYIDLTNKAFTNSIEITTEATTRVLDYVKASFDVVAKPYAITTPDAFVRENLDRTTQLVELREKYLKATTSHATQIANSAVTETKVWQDTTQRAMQAFGEVMVSNLNFVKEAAGKQIDGIAKQVVTSSKN